MNDNIGTLIEPQPVQFTWGAPGWYVLAGLLLVVIVAVIVMIVRHYRRNRYRSEALAWLVSREKEMSQHPEVVVYDATMLMKRIVISRYGREHASVREREWIGLLNDTCKGQLFSDADSTWLTQSLYAGGTKIAAADVQAYLNKTRTWIKRHRYAL